MSNEFCLWKSPIGMLHLESDEIGICRLSISSAKAECPPETALLKEAVKQLKEYFEGHRTEFDLPLSLHGTEFQRQAWSALCEIPYGCTVSYGEQAARLGNPKAARAVGMANNKNPVMILVPCHRVIGKNGSLTGYAGGLEAKQMLLELEAAHR